MYRDFVVLIIHEHDKIISIFDEQIVQLTGGTIIISNLVNQTEFDDTRIASLTDATVSFVGKVRAELDQKKRR